MNSFMFRKNPIVSHMIILVWILGMTMILWILTVPYLIILHVGIVTWVLSILAAWLQVPSMVKKNHQYKAPSNTVDILALTRKSSLPDSDYFSHLLPTEIIILILSLLEPKSLNNLKSLPNFNTNFFKNQVFITRLYSSIFSRITIMKYGLDLKSYINFFASYDPDRISYYKHFSTLIDLNNKHDDNNDNENNDDDDNKNNYYYMNQAAHMTTDVRLLIWNSYTELKSISNGSYFSTPFKQYGLDDTSYDALINDDLDLFKITLRSGADIHNYCYPQTSALIAALWHDSSKIIDFLLEDDSDVNHCSLINPNRNPKYSPLMEAIKHKNWIVVDHLLKKKININEMKNNQTAYDLVLESKNQLFIDIIREVGGKTFKQIESRRRHKRKIRLSKKL